ncbi:MAG: hypothetical protein CMJ40_07930 [Phycisphaerae bacterium]|nr:hypothetical protein [Phycisphaerae bacterium]
MPVDPVILMPDEPDPMKDDRVCSQCGYSLKGLARGVACPECGTPESDQEPARLPGGLSKPTKTTPQCSGCGYLLKGLPSVGTCPECGTPYKPETSRRRNTDLITPRTLVSSRFRFGLTLLITAITSALFMQVIVLFYKIQPDDYRLVMTMSGFVWSIGLCLVVVRRVAGQNRFLKLVWLITLASQWLWPLAYALGRYGSMNQNPGGSFITFGIMILDVVASLGMFSSLCFLAMICRDLYLRRQASRIELVALIFPFYAIGIWIFPYPAEVQDGLFNSGGGFRLIIFIVLLGPWWLLFLMTGLALKDIYVRSIWEGRIQRANADRLRSASEEEAGNRGAVDSHLSGPTEEPPEVESEYWEKSGDIPLSPPDSPTSE